jgi:hypothetical protein
MAEVTVNGNTYNDGSTTGKYMGNGGHRANLIPMLSDSVTDLAAKVAAAELAEEHAETAETNAEAVLLNAGFIAVAADLVGPNTIGAAAAIDAEIVAVAAIDAEVAAVAGNAASITAVANNAANINAVNANQTNINAAADNMAAIIAAPTEASNAAGSAASAGVYAAQAAASAAALHGTSTTSLLIAVAEKVFTTQTDEAYTAGVWITATSAADIANWMYGQVVSYSGATLNVDVQVIGGSGTHADWNLSISAARGATGATGTGLTEQATGFTATGGTTSKTLTVDDDILVSDIKAGVYGGVADPDIVTGAAHTITGTTFVVPVTISAFGPVDKDALRLAVDYREDGATEWTRTSTISVTTLADHDVTVPGLTEDTLYDYRAVALDALNPVTGVLGDIAQAQTLDIYIATPTLTVPGSPVSVLETPTLSTGAFAVENGEDTHQDTDWQILDSEAAVVWQSLADSSNKTSIAVPADNLLESTTYTFRVRHRGTAYGVSAWDEVEATTVAVFYEGIGAQGAQGFGCNAYPGDPADLAALGLTAMSGTTDKAHANYGNYQHSNGGISVFVPRFYYRIGSASSPRYATYGLNAVDVTSDFADEATANAAGYALHRALKDGGATKLGFFADKYLASKDGTGSCKSVANGVPISLTTSATYTNSNGMTGCTGILADAVVLSRARGAGWHCQTIFQSAAIALLALAHGQAAASTTYCAWYDSGLTTNFPKGCNNNALADTSDAGVTYTTAGDSGSANKPKTGSGSPFAKTTHNGQACGVADINGCMYQVLIGITSPGANATDTTQITNGNVYTLKESVAAANLTGGWNTGANAWGGASHLATYYDAQTGLLPWGATTGWEYFGNSTNRVFDPATSGAGWLRTACGIPQDTSATSAGGTNLYGNDGCYRYNIANLFVRSAGNWGDAASAGAFYRDWGSSRSLSNIYYGFRASCYGS